MFYGLSALPPFWQHIAQYNPLFYIVDFVRYAFIGYSSVNPVVALVAIVLLIAILYSLACYLLSRGTDKSLLPTTYFIHLFNNIEINNIFCKYYEK